jgi:hypothetical protein
VTLKLKRKGTGFAPSKGSLEDLVKADQRAITGNEKTLPKRGLVEKGSEAIASQANQTTLHNNRFGPVSVLSSLTEL